MYLLRVFLFGLAIVFFSGCGKALNLSVRAADSEVNQPSAAVARRVDLNYYDGAGKLQATRSFEIEGLSRPVFPKNELLKGVSWEKSGTFEATAYSSENLMVLRGSAHPDDKESKVTITLDRLQSLAAMKGRAIIRAGVVMNGAGGESFQFDQPQLRETAAGGHCLAVPELRADGARTYPQLKLHASIKSPILKYDLGEGSGDPRLVPLDGAGDASLELGPSFHDGMLTKGPSHFKLRLFSNDYEGCLELSTGYFVLNPIADPKPVARRWEKDGRAGPAYVLLVRNPNPVPIDIVIEASASFSDTNQSVQVCYSKSNDALFREGFPCLDVAREGIHIPANDYDGIFIFGAFEKPWRNGIFRDSKVLIKWSIKGTARVGGRDEPLGEQSFHSVF